MKTPAAGWFPLIRGAYGLVLLGAPGLLPRLACRPGDRRVQDVARVLGARQLAQAALTAPAPSAATLALGAETDLAHALSMLGLALADRRRRRLGCADAAVAAIFAAAGVAAARQVQAAPPAPAGPGHPAARAVHLRDIIAAAVAVRTIPPPICRRLTGDHAPPSRSGTGPQGVRQA